MVTEHQNPLRVYCKTCGGAAGYDIVRQTYRCTHCGGLTGIQEVQDSVSLWRKLRQNSTEVRADGEDVEEHKCPSCGAGFVFAAGEASEICDFCGTKLVRKALTKAEQLPELIIPFFITPEEAKERMRKWGKEHDRTPEGKGVLSNMDGFRGYYLPYQLVRGPVCGTVTRDGNVRRYQCGGYLEGTAVNTSKQLDNLVLNDIEPFDWSELRPFGFGYIAGHRVKLSDISDAETHDRVLKEVAEDFLPEVRKVMQTNAVHVKVRSGDLMAVSALMPVYFIKSGKLTAVMNGQTGRIAVSKNRKKTTYPWVVEPLVYTIVATFLLSYWYKFAVESVLLSSMFFSILFFAIMGNGKNPLIRRISLRSETAKAARKDGALNVEEGKDILKNPYDNTPVFYEPNDKGEMVPVRIKFYTFSRWLTIIFNTLVTIFLPVTIAAPIRFLSVWGTDGLFMDKFQIQYGAAWYVLAVLMAILYLAKGVRQDVYDHPLLYEILPDGKVRLTGKRSDRKVGLLSMFGIGRLDSEGKKLTLFGMARSLGCVAGGFLFGGILLLLLGSVAAILT